MSKSESSTPSSGATSTGASASTQSGCSSTQPRDPGPLEGISASWDALSPEEQAKWRERQQEQEQALRRQLEALKSSLPPSCKGSS
ncbi:hypothetical protein PsYK624_150730 [Phanerochaete sordida]|uniref:Uncharacterized protein n=1 Tax=Phanerochaete sordida TaxID=48140 RepID=A0A9P3GQ62_9APHY|nr:hypothetical protein PsYK624_150730 [Phanerochaete sordida]